MRPIMLRLNGRGRRGQAGITLIELLVSIVVLAILSTMLVTVWLNVNRSSTSVVIASDSRATARDAMSRISSELRGAQPTALPTATPSATATPSRQPPFTMAAPMEVRFYSAFNNSSPSSYGGSRLTALRPTRIWLDTATVPSAPWSAQGRTLYLQRDMNINGSFTDSVDRSMVLARNVFNNKIADSANGTAYTAVFRYAYRDAGGHIVWTDNAGSTLILGSIVAIRVRLIVDTNSSRAPNYIDTSTTVRPRNASSQ
jgi:prepilin-type N-terminal cleavage/methylation domain-containing protein